MSRYIDADVLMEVLERSAKDPRNETAMTSWANAFQELIDLLEETLIPMSTTDVVEVVHGRWIDTGSGQECSICKEIQYGYDSARNYCANCGAKMDMKGETDEQIH